MSTLENAVSVLRIFGPDRRDISVTEIARLLSMPKSSASRLLASMRDVGFLDSLGKPPRYRVGTRFFEVARQHRLKSSLSDLADGVLERICAKTGHTGYVSILQGTDVIVIRVRQGSHGLQVVTPLGQRLSAFQTAIGRSLLARLTDDEVRSRYPAPLKLTSRNSPQSLTALLRSFAKVRRRGWSDASDEVLPGVGSTPVSINDVATSETVGVCLSYSVLQVSVAVRKRIAGLLTDATRELGETLDDPFWESRAKNGSDADSIAFLPRKASGARQAKPRVQ